MIENARHALTMRGDLALSAQHPDTQNKTQNQGNASALLPTTETRQRPLGASHAQIFVTLVNVMTVTKCHERTAIALHVRAAQLTQRKRLRTACVSQPVQQVSFRADLTVRPPVWLTTALQHTCSTNQRLFLTV